MTFEQFYELLLAATDSLNKEVNMCDHIAIVHTRIIYKIGKYDVVINMIQDKISDPIGVNSIGIWFSGQRPENDDLVTLHDFDYKSLIVILSFLLNVGNMQLSGKVNN